MGLRLLVFSSDAEAALVLAQVLSELEIEVDFCTEIFSSVQKVTKQPCDAIIIDWDEGAEATFLLKTARELKATRECLAVALVADAAQATCALQVGAHGTLKKPINPVEARETLSTVRDVVVSRQPASPETRADSAIHQLEAQDQIAELASVARSPVAASTPPMVHGEQPPEALCPPELVVLLPAPDSPTPDRTRNHEPEVRLPSFLAVEPGPSKLKPRRSVRLALMTCLLIASAGFYVLAPGSAFMDRASSVVLATFGMRETGSMEVTVPVSDPSDDTPNAGPVKHRSKEFIAAVETRSGRKNPDGGIQVVPSASSRDHAASVPGHQPVSDTPTSIKNQQSSKPSGQPGIQIPDSLRASSAATSSPAASAPAPSGLFHPLILPEEISRQLLVSTIQPTYPEKALRSGLQGVVVLQAWTARDGRILDLKLVSGYFVLGRAALEAVKQWRYKPYYLNGQAVETQTLITVSFKLPSLGMNLREPAADSNPATAGNARQP